ncbi:unnamed protein product [Pleuronectes platessa]|uniref:Uncharacterized protein n=1 Tax=Pleuronectes platessa TaxID=8262 RepID=A0A9N7TKJ3_PLEPL|nr:unnamed protein product [Pleuronectes platessa]
METCPSLCGNCNLNLGHRPTDFTTVLQAKSRVTRSNTDAQQQTEAFITPKLQTPHVHPIVSSEGACNMNRLVTSGPRVWASPISQHKHPGDELSRSGDFGANAALGKRDYAQHPLFQIETHHLPGGVLVTVKRVVYDEEPQCDTQAPPTANDPLLTSGDEWDNEELRGASTNRHFLLTHAALETERHKRQDLQESNMTQSQQRHDWFNPWQMPRMILDTMGQGRKSHQHLMQLSKTPHGTKSSQPEEEARAGVDEQSVQTAQRSGSHFLQTNSGGTGSRNHREVVAADTSERRRPGFDHVDRRLVSPRC